MLHKKLETGTCVCTWNYEDDNCMGQTVAVKNDNGKYEPIIHVESVGNKGFEGVDAHNVVYINKDKISEAGFLIVEDYDADVNNKTQIMIHDLIGAIERGISNRYKVFKTENKILYVKDTETNDRFMIDVLRLGN